MTVDHTVVQRSRQDELTRAIQQPFYPSKVKCGGMENCADRPEYWAG